MEIELETMADREPLMGMGGEPAAHNDVTVEADSKSPGRFVWMLTLSAGISGLLFGCKASSF